MRIPTLIDVPTALGLSPAPRDGQRPRGTWRAPAALRAAGLATQLAGRSGPAVKVAPTTPSANPGPGRGTQLSAAAGEDLAIITGRGLPPLADAEGLGPLVADEDVVALAERERDVDTSDILDTEIDVVDLGEVRRRGPARAGDEAVARMRSNSCAGFWVHLDVDVLDGLTLAAVDSPQPGGLRPDELVALLRPLLRNPRAVGMDLTVYDPELDPTGQGARVIVDLLGDAFDCS